MTTIAEYTHELTLLGYSFRMNEVNDAIEVSDALLSDPLAAEIRARMRERGHKNTKELEDAYTAHAHQSRYHPIREYLTGLQWNGYPNIEALAAHFQDKHSVFYSFFRRWLIGAVAKAIAGGQNFMLVLDGPQDIGKSYFVRWLCPLDQYFVEGAINTEEKDAWLRLCSKWIWEVGELGATTRRADREALKDFITRREVVVRKPYGHYDMMKPALASLAGTINSEGAGFLNDPTGNRRFAIVDLTGIDWDYCQKVDKNQLWAEAYTLYQAGETWRLDDQERTQQATINADYENQSNVEEMLRQNYIIDPAGTVWQPAIGIVLKLEERGLNRNNQRGALIEIASLMKKWGIEKCKVNGVWSYRGVELIV